MSKINDILRLVAGLERYQGVLGESRRKAERQNIIGAVNALIGTLHRDKIDFDVNEAFEAVREGIGRAEEHYQAALEADKMLPFASPLQGDAPQFVDSLKLSLGITTGRFVQDMHDRLAAQRAAAEAAAKAATIAAAAALPQEPEPVKPRVDPDEEIARGFSELKATLESL
jgi:hypothetical protein